MYDIVINKIKEKTESYTIIKKCICDENSAGKLYTPHFNENDKYKVAGLDNAILIHAFHDGFDITEIYLSEYSTNETKYYCAIKNKGLISFMLYDLYIDLNSDFSKDSYIKPYVNEKVYKTIIEYIKSIKDSVIISQHKFGKEWLIDDDLNKDYYFDLNKIVTCKSFRRLQDKTQIFSSKYGDHFRTRLTHTIEVNEIAKRIARNINKYKKNINLNII